MKKTTKGLALLLAVLMIAAMLPISAMASMLPLDTEYLTLDLKGYYNKELTFTVQEIMDKLGIEEAPAVWARYYYYDDDGNYVSRNDNYQRVAPTDTVDFSTWFNGGYIDMITGAVDQLNPQNKMYQIDVEASADDDTLMANIVSAEDGGALTVSNVTMNMRYQDCYVYVLDSPQSENEKERWDAGEDFYLSFKNKDGDTAEDLSFRFYEGLYEDENELNADKDITDKIWEVAPEDGYLVELADGVKYAYIDLTLAIHRDGKLVGLYPLECRVTHDGLYVYDGSIIEKDSSDSASNSYSYSYETGVMTLTHRLKEGKSANAQYRYIARIKLDSDDWMWIYYPSYGVDLLKGAYVGKYTALEDIPADAEDIKEELCGDGYLADYSKGVYFTFVGNNLEVECIQIKVKENTKATVEEAGPNSADTYFRMQSAVYYVEDDTQPVTPKCWVMPYGADSYYVNGYQTVFLCSYYDEGTIIPSFYTGDGVSMFTGSDGAGGVKQESGKSEVEFESGNILLYSAAAENGKNLKNYFVTFLTRQSGPRLFVNATNDESRYVKVNEGTDEEESIPSREVFLTERYDYHHDVFFANIGDEAIKGLYVRLEDAQNIALDEYWTIGETTELAPFDEEGFYSYGNYQLNVGKIRLIPELDDEGNILGGDISGTLVIGYTGEGTEPVEEVRISLTGVAGESQIITRTLHDGVKFVPYSSLIQTNNMYSDDVAFSITSGRLPKGMKLKPNGEIYGISSEVGEFTFTVQAEFKYDGKTDTDSREFTLTILDNSDDHVNAVNESEYGYPVIDQLPRTINLRDYSADDTFVFHTEGVFGDFMAFYIDGVKLVENVDYKISEGSTVITIFEQTLGDVGDGEHTISAEFREEGAEDGSLRASAQNITIEGSVPSGGGGGGNNNLGGVAVPATSRIIITESNEGKISVDEEYPAIGSTAILTVTPNEGFEIDSVEVDGAKVTDLGNGKYSIAVSSFYVTVKVTFKATEPEVIDFPFKDVDEDDWFYEAVKFAYEKQYMIGTGKDTFDPQGNASRGMFLTILHRFAGSPDPKTRYNFADIEPDDYYAKAAVWALENGLIEVGEDRCFNPDISMTRETMAIILYRFAKLQNYELDIADISTYTDLGHVTPEGYKAFAWARARGLIIGTSDTTIAPSDTFTRAQMATIIMRLCKL